MTTTVTRTDHAAAAPAVRPDRLVAQVEQRRARANGVPVRVARRLLSLLLERMHRDQLTVIDRNNGVGELSTFGSVDGVGPSSLHATIEILDGRAWTAVATEGSIGLGRSYAQGRWDSDDLVSVLRIIIRNLERADELRNQVAARTGWMANRVRNLLPRPNRSRNKEDIASHYDLGNEFFGLFLDETLTYSSAVFGTADTELAEASNFKYDRLLSKLGVRSEHSLLEVGAGWGGFALRAASTIGCHVTTTTISDQQLQEATRRIRAADRSDLITLLDSDWRDLRGQFDRVVSIEMIEAVDWRDYDDFFATIEGCMKPDGLFAIQAICVPDRRYERTKNTEDFIRRFVFPGGFLPSLGAISKSVSRATKMQIIDVEDLSAHYAETLRRWRERFDDRIDDARALGLDDRFCRLWRFYLAYCEAAFSERHCTVNQVLLAGPRWRPEGLALRPG